MAALQQLSFQLLPTWEGTIDSRYPYGFLDGSGITLDYAHEPAEWDYALMGREHEHAK